MAKCKISHRIEVSLPDTAYSILITESGLKDVAFLRRHVTSRQLMIVSNETVAPLYLKDLQTAFADRQCDSVILKDGEQYKNQHSLNRIYDALIDHKHHRDTTLIALGGGVIGDITGFAAATYQRGVSFIQMPTTLLAQVDASIGGKTAINHPGGKNLIGCFHQPQTVIIDMHSLDTLLQREFNAGLAEVIKYAIIAGEPFLGFLSDTLKKGLSAKNHMELERLIAECCRIKAEIVRQDEKEKGQRALLNLGHTFGHALEAQTNFQRWLHGEAVAIGLYCAALLSQRLGYVDNAFVSHIENMLIQAKLPHKIPKNIDLNELRALMSLDKKIKNNVLCFVLIRDAGGCFMSSEVSESLLNQTLLDATEGD